MLGERFRLLRFEHRGHGGSPAPPGPYTIGELGADVLARCWTASGCRPPSYCGISLGGMIGMWLAAHAPERIDALGLCCTSAYLPPACGPAGRRRRGRRAWRRCPSRWWGAGSLPPSGARDPATVARFVDRRWRGWTRRVTRAAARRSRALDLRSSLGRISAPTLVIAGAEDPATPPWHGARIASAVGRSRLRVIRGGSHLANVSQPGEVTAALLAHLTSAPGRLGADGPSVRLPLAA